MKKLLALLLSLLAPHAIAATVYACACGAGFATGCVAGSQTPPYDTPAKAINTIAQWKTSFGLLQAGDQLLTCQGGAFDGVATGNMSNANATRASPVVVGSYDDTPRWTGGAGIRPKFNHSGGAGTGALSFLKASPAHTEGLTIRNIEVVGDGVNTVWGIIVAADTDYIVIDGVKVSGSIASAIQLQGAAISPQAVGDGISQGLVIRNSIVTNNKRIGILAGTSNTLIEKNTFDRNGTDGFDHDIYMGGTYTVVPVKTIASITGNGSLATLTTATPHGIAIGARMTLGVSGTTSSGSGSFNATGGLGGQLGTVTGASTITYAATGTPSASVVGTYTAYVDVPVTQVTVRNNTITNGSLLGNPCNLSHIVFHGDFTNVLVENNFISESTPGASGCSAIDLNSGAYGTPENFEKFTNVVVRGNTGINLFYGISLDLCSQCLVENNYMHVSGTPFATGGIIMRGKNFVPGTAGSSTLAATHQSPHNVTIRYNTVYLTSPSAGSWGITLNGNVGDPLTGSNHNLYGNVVVFGASATTGTQCYNTQNLTLAKFTIKNNNACYYLGAAVPKWDQTFDLATVQAVGDANKSDINSLMAATADATTGQPFFTAPTTGPNISTSSALKNAGHSLGPTTGWGGSKRTIGVRDIGAFEFGATLGVVPGSPTVRQ